MGQKGFIKLSNFKVNKIRKFNVNKLKLGIIVNIPEFITYKSVNNGRQLLSHM